MNSIDQQLGRWQWWRRMRGGHWERWYCQDPLHKFVWLRLNECMLPWRWWSGSSELDYTLFVGVPLREDW